MQRVTRDFVSFTLFCTILLFVVLFFFFFLLSKLMYIFLNMSEFLHINAILCLFMCFILFLFFFFNALRDGNTDQPRLYNNMHWWSVVTLIGCLDSSSTSHKSMIGKKAVVSVEKSYLETKKKKKIKFCIVKPNFR